MTCAGVFFTCENILGTELYSLGLVQQYLQRTSRLTVRVVTALQDIDEIVYIIFVLGQLLFDKKIPST